MNKNDIQRFAVWARTELIAQVSQRAYQYGITAEGYGDANAATVGGRALSREEQRQRGELVTQIQSKGYTQVMEEVAYTWFNRFIALRFMEVNNYLPTHVRIFSDSSGAFKPEILNDVLHLELPGLDMEKVSDLIEKNQTEDLYRYLLLTQCNALNESLPRMFERMGSYTELLLPNNILRQDGILGRMVAEIPEENWTDQVQIIGWLYQYYNSEKKNEVFAALKKNVKITKENIPAATQLFTPDWIVRYMVENSLGRLWVEGHPNDALKSEWKYYLEEAEQEPEVQAQLATIRKEYAALKPEDIRCIDPCCGSGHILCYLFDVLMQIYESQGYSPRDAAQSIVRHNLHGLDIDERAAQLAYFSVMMKARQYDRRFLTRSVQPNVYAIKESNWIGGSFPFDMGEFLHSKEHQETLNYLIEAFQDAKEYGSILQLEQRDYASFIEAWELTASQTAGQIGLLLWYDAIKDAVPELAKLAILLTQKYHVVCTNPPYMGSGGMNGRLAEYVKKSFPDSKSDVSTVFMERTLQLCDSTGYMSMINIPVWMFLSSYEKLRKKLLSQNTITSMIHPGRGIFGSDFGTTTFVISKRHIKNYTGTYRRLFDKQGDVESIEEREIAFLSGKGSFFAQQDNFSKIPGSPVAYWVSNQLLHIFSYPKAKEVGRQCLGMRTGDNERFLRFWHEVDVTKMKTNCSSKQDAIISHCKWFPYNKGGEFRKWYGNLWYVVNWENDGAEIKDLVRQVYPQLGDNLGWKISNEDKYFCRGIAWSRISSSYFGVRLCDANIIFDTNAPMMFANDEKLLTYYAGILTSKVATVVLTIINPTISFQVGDVGEVPIILDEAMIPKVDNIVQVSTVLSREDWDSFEISWDFEMHPIAKKALSRFHWNDDGAITIEYVYRFVAQDFEDRFQKLKANEEELNRIFIDIYGLQNELTPEVEDKDVTVRRADLGRDIRSMISYAVGCMFGRYSLGHFGLAYAGGEWDSSKYTSFLADADNIIPICDDDYFDDDITGRFIKWVETVFGKETLEENLKFIADALGGKGTPREVIRGYFLNSFYTDHLKIYQKRPIYWLFDSGKKNGFKALIYMHRYQSDLLARMRTDYVHEQQERYRTQLKHIGDVMDSASTSERVRLAKQQKKLQEQALELQKYEEKVHHLADQNIKIDLDDGVVHNYELFAGVLAKRN